MDDLLNTKVEIVAKAGSAKSSFTEALHILLMEDDVAKADEIYKQGVNSYKEAHDAHLKILQKFASEEEIITDVLLVHAECHMTSAEDLMTISGQLLEYKKKGKGNV